MLVEQLVPVVATASRQLEACHGDLALLATLKHAQLLAALPTATAATIWRGVQIVQLGPLRWLLWSPLWLVLLWLLRSWRC